MSLVFSAPVRASEAPVFDTGASDAREGYFFIGTGEDDQLYAAFTASAATITGLQGYFRQTLNARYRASLYADDHGLPDIAHPLASTEFDAPLDPALGAQDPATPIGGAIHQSVTVGDVYWVGFGFLGGDTDHGLIASGGLANPALRYAFSNLANSYDTSRNLYLQANMDFGIRVLGEASAVPEPGAWPLLLVGVGMLGAALRKRGPGETLGGA